ncbi:MAG TPA: hypothetical protein VNU66_14435 [Mycobacteriales bacterium]|nr:hypothetical protein [Mycobacteriales bacterium]
MSRLVTTVLPAPGPRVSVSLLHELELDDGRRVLLLDDRGFGSTASWSQVTRADVERDARTCVGPDEPFGDRTADDMARDHWAELAARAGVPAPELAALPHDVELHPDVEARLG